MIASDELTENRYLLARVGVHGQVGRFSTELGQFRRGQRAVCRTTRGVEVAQILGPALGPVEDSLGGEALDGRILRLMTAEDELLWNQLKQHADEAHAACQAWLQQTHPESVLLDVEPLLDGRTVYFHFLNEVPQAVQTFIDGLVEVYEQQVRNTKFANLLEHGCGPKCGTAEAENGCSSRGGCAVCQVAGACRK